MSRMGSSFKGNPNTNDAARYSAALRRWRADGCKGPPPERPASLQTILPDEPRENLMGVKQREQFERDQAKKKQKGMF